MGQDLENSHLGPSILPIPTMVRNEGLLVTYVYSKISLQVVKMHQNSISVIKI